ncbi:MAG: DUF1731 domain-containing protein [Deltaproteobacteria bacterium]|nr:DUF1731 domain-containing protein [Deltaproteobacteria bacterium]
MIKAFFQNRGKEILSKGCRVIPKKLITDGYNFMIPNLKTP